MNEKEIKELIQNLDNDLIEKELEDLMEDMDFDMESISQKAYDKLNKETMHVKKKKFVPVVAAALVAVMGLSTVYADEISAFMQSFLNKTVVYDTVVDGDAFYLDEPFQLKDGQVLDIMFTQDNLIMTLDYTLVDDKLPELSVQTPSGEKYLATGYAQTNRGLMLLFSSDYLEKLKPKSEITLNIADQSYTITLKEGQPVADTGEMTEAQASVTNCDWVHIGCQQTEQGVKILASFDVEGVKLHAIGQPEIKNAESHFKNEANGSIIGGGTSTMTLPLEAVGKDNKTYRFVKDEKAVGRPVTTFLSDAPDDVTLYIPSLIVGLEETMDTINLTMPAVGEETALNKEIDLGLQKMVLQTVKRTSETTAELTFALNTGEKSEVTIREGGIYSSDVINGESKWGDSICVTTLTFDKDLKSAALSISWPTFVINGNWEIDCAAAANEGAAN